MRSQTRSLIACLLLMSIASAAVTNLTAYEPYYPEEMQCATVEQINCASPISVSSIEAQVRTLGVQVSSSIKIIDDIDRRTDAMDSRMVTPAFVDARIDELQNVTAKAEDFELLKQDFIEFKQDQNWKWLTYKIETFALIMFGLGALFLFQKFWEFGQVLFNRWADKLDKQEKEKQKAATKEYKTLIATKDKEITQLKREKRPTFLDWFLNRGRKKKKAVSK